MKKKIYELVKRQGFITFLFVCVCVVAGTTLYLSMRSLDAPKDSNNDKDLAILDEKDSEEPALDSEEKDKDLKDGKDKEITELEEYASKDEKQDEETKEVASMEEVKEEKEAKEVKEIEKPKEVKEESKEVKEASKTDELNKAEEAVKVAKAEEVKELEFEEDNFEEKEKQASNLKEDVITILLPLEGEVITEYTNDTLIYSETLEAWVGHGAIDIKGDQGANVSAAMDGVVKKVYKDDLWGIVIIIDHGKGLETRYSNLATMDMIKEGVSVKKGDHISKVGKTAKIEMHMEPHLHFEVRKDGKIVDPCSIIK